MAGFGGFCGLIQYRFCLVLGWVGRSILWVGVGVGLLVGVLAIARGCWLWGFGFFWIWLLRWVE